MKFLDKARKSEQNGITEDEWRRADKGFVFTRSGLRVPFMNLDNTEFNVLDMCHGVAHNLRWNGATKIPWTVAQHSLLVSRMVEELKWNTDVKNIGIAQLKALTHDFTEAYLGDVATPIKRELELYMNIENKLEERIEQTLDLDKHVDEEIEKLVKRADTLSLLVEALTIMNIDDNYRDYCIKELETKYSDVKGMRVLERYSSYIKVENPDYVAGKLLVELHKQSKNNHRNMKCFNGIPSKYLEEVGMIPIFIDGKLKYRVYEFGKSISVKRESDRVSFNIPMRNFENMFSIELIESMEKGQF